MNKHANWMQIKQAYDPLCLLNCDKIVRVEKAAVEEKW
jgi:hypothetical protein